MQQAGADGFRLGAFQRQVLDHAAGRGGLRAPTRCSAVLDDGAMGQWAIDRESGLANAEGRAPTTRPMSIVLVGPPSNAATPIVNPTTNGKA